MASSRQTRRRSEHRLPLVWEQYEIPTHNGTCHHISLTPTPNTGYRTSGAAVLVAHDHLLYHLHDLRVPVQHHPTALPHGPYAIVLHDLLGRRRAVYRVRPELYAAHHTARSAGNVRGKLSWCLFTIYDPYWLSFQYQCCISPGFILVVGSWYTTREHASRSLVFQSANAGFGIIAHLILYGIGSLQYSRGPQFQAWRYMSYVGFALYLCYISPQGRRN